MHSDHHLVLDGIVGESTQELLESYGLRFSIRRQGPFADELVTALGFAGRGISGSLSVATSYRVARRIVQEVPGATDIEDWIGELTNQLLGGIQRRLLRRGASIAAGLPVVVRGEELDLANNGRSSSSATSDIQRFRIDRMVDLFSGVVRVRVMVELESWFQLQPASDPAMQPLAEGEPLLF